MNLLLLNVLLILIGPFLVVAPFALLAWREFAPARRVPHFRLSFAAPRRAVPSWA